MLNYVTITGAPEKDFDNKKMGVITRDVEKIIPDVVLND